MEKFCIVTAAFGDAYIEQMERLKKSVHAIYPKVQVFSWTNELPYGSRPHLGSEYGFKVHAINHARASGYTKIIWMDTALILVDKVDPWFEMTKQYGVVAAADHTGLYKTCSDRVFVYFGVNKEYCKEQDQRLVGGSLFVFDFENPLCREIYSRWANAEHAGMFASDGPHRWDEACMAHALYLSGSSPVPYPVCRYNEVPNPIVIKKHFK